jgi:restriction system protein
MSFIIFLCVIVIVLILFVNKKTIKQKPSRIRKTKRSSKQKPAILKEKVNLSHLEQISLISQLATEQKHLTSNEWTVNLLLSLEWKRFEEICKEYLIMTNHHAELTNIGADGGVDIRIRDIQNNIIAIGQCKAWLGKITVKEVREFFGVMASEKILVGYYLATSSFTADAIQFCANKNITLLDKDDLVKNIKQLSKKNQTKLYKIATQGDYTTPTCPNCDKKMLKRANKTSGSEFWGCINYPMCKNTLQVRKITSILSIPS